MKLLIYTSLALGLVAASPLPSDSSLLVRRGATFSRFISHGVGGGGGGGGGSSDHSQELAVLSGLRSTEHEASASSSHPLPSYDANYPDGKLNEWTYLQPPSGPHGEAAYLQPDKKVGHLWNNMKRWKFKRGGIWVRETDSNSRWQPGHVDLDRHLWALKQVNMPPDFRFEPGRNPWHLEWQDPRH